MKITTKNLPGVLHYIVWTFLMVVALLFVYDLLLIEYSIIFHLGTIPPEDFNFFHGFITGIFFGILHFIAIFIIIRSRAFVQKILEVIIDGRKEEDPLR